MPKEASYIVKVNNTNDNIQNTFIKSIRTMNDEKVGKTVRLHMLLLMQ